MSNSENKWQEAVAMWHDGFDTMEIARAFRCHESVIYRLLPHYREKYKGASVKEGVA
jgi:transposase